MTDYTDLIARLRMDVKSHEITHNGGMKRVQAVRDAIAAIEALQAEVARLQGETQPNEVTAPTSGG